MSQQISIIQSTTIINKSTFNFNNKYRQSSSTTITIETESEHFETLLPLVASHLSLCLSVYLSGCLFVCLFSLPCPLRKVSRTGECSRRSQHGMPACTHARTHPRRSMITPVLIVRIRSQRYLPLNSSSTQYVPGLVSHVASQSPTSQSPTTGSNLSSNFSRHSFQTTASLSL